MVGMRNFFVARWRGLFLTVCGLLGVVAMVVGLGVLPRSWYPGVEVGEGVLGGESVVSVAPPSAGELEEAGLPNPVPGYGMGVVDSGFRVPGEAEVLFAPRPVREFHVKCEVGARGEVSAGSGFGWAAPSVGVSSAGFERRAVPSGGSAAVPSAPLGMVWDNGVGVGSGEGVLMGLGHVNYDFPFHLSLSPFGALHRLGECDSVYVWEGGVVREYVVERLFTVPQGEFSSRSELFRRSGEHSLVLVTCSGAQVGEAFGSVLGGYTDNLVVIARPVG